jgi:hypothetical protein
MTPTPSARLTARQVQVLRILNTPAGVYVRESPLLDAVAYAERMRRRR